MYFRALLSAYERLRFAPTVAGRDHHTTIPGMSSGAVASQSQAERESVKRIDSRSNALRSSGNVAKILEIILLFAAVGAILAVFSLPILFRFVNVSYCLNLCC